MSIRLQCNRFLSSILVQDLITILYNIKKQKNRARSSVNKLKIIKEKDFSYFDDLIYLGAEFRPQIPLFHNRK